LLPERNLVARLVRNATMHDVQLQRMQKHNQSIEQRNTS
jgi:hypothetical protein